MPLSYIDYGVGDGVTLTSDQQAGDFNNITLGYINTSDIYVIRTTSTGVKTTLNSNQYTITVAGSVTNVQIHTPTNGLANAITIDPTDLIRIGRTTDVTALTRTFTDGSVLKADDLNAANNQLLFALQEDTDIGAGSLPIDTDSKYDAGGRVIKNLGEGSNASDAVTRSYVDGLTLYGAAVAQPMAWSFTLSQGTTSGSDLLFTLTDPVSTHTSEELYIIELDGVIQTPDTYTVTEVSGVYTLKLIGAASLGGTLALSIRNIGVGRHVIQMPFKAETGSHDSVAIQRIGSQTGNLLHAYDENDPANTLAKIAADGDATFTDVNATGNASVTGTAAVTGNFSINTNKFTVDASNGNTAVAGSTTLTGGVSGGLNILTGALQMAGSDVLTIRQFIMQDALTGSETSALTDSKWTQLGSSSTDYKVSGLRVSVPALKSSSSKLIIIMTPLLYGYSGTGTRTIDVLGKIYKNNTASMTNDVNGSGIAGSFFRNRQNVPNSGVSISGSVSATDIAEFASGGSLASSDSFSGTPHTHTVDVPSHTHGDSFAAAYSGTAHSYIRPTWFYVIESPDTGATTYDLGIATNNAETNCYVYPTSAYSQMIAIEIG